MVTIKQRRKRFANCLIVGPDDKVLIIKDPAKPLYEPWRLPGKLLRRGESPFEGVRTGIRQEVGLEVDNLTLLLHEAGQRRESYLFAARASSFDGVKNFVKENLFVACLPIEELGTNEKLSDNNKRMLLKLHDKHKTA